jgi:hypothetical protein
MSERRAGRLWRGVAALAVALLSAGARPGAAADAASAAQDAALKAAFVYKFAQFTNWESLAAGAPIVMCTAGDEAVSAALVDSLRGQSINTHPIDVARQGENTTWSACHVLFIDAGEVRRSTGGLSAIRTLPILSVSNGKGFADRDGIIELYVDRGKTAFAINIDATARSGVRLSSQLLAHARIVRDRDVK